MDAEDHLTKQMHALSLLRDAVDDGRLDLVEFDRRSALLVEGGVNGISRALEGVSPARMSQNRSQHPSSLKERYIAALRIEWAVWIVVSLINLAVWWIVALIIEPVYFWPGWVIGPWGATLGVREMVEFMRRKRWYN